jgi:hypothetical protein
MSETRLGRPLTKEEFEQLLQRAVERQELAASRAFTVEELVEAGQELGLDADTVRGVYREHQQELSQPAGRQRPFDSKLRLYKDAITFRLTMPPALNNQVSAGVQTAVAAGFAGWFATFSPPTPAIAGVAALVLAFGYFRVRSACSVRELRLGRDGSGLLIRFRRGRGRGIPLKAGQVHARLAERVVEGRHHTRRVPHVALDHGTDTYELLEGYSPAEHAWAVQEIERWLGRPPGS